MLYDWWISRRNALLADPRFQRFALRFAPLRPVARAHAGRLFDLVAGFTYSQTLFACVELDLFETLAAGPAPIAGLAANLDLTTPMLDRLVGAAAALGLLERLAGDRVALSVAGAAMRGDPGIAAMVAHHRRLYADLADPVALLRRPGGGTLAAFWAYDRGTEDAAVADYSELMARSIDPVAQATLDAHDLRRHRRLLDIGGGEGRFLQAARRRAPVLELGLFDLPGVAARAHALLGDAATIHSGDFRHDPLPPGYDCITLVRVLHDHDDDVACALLRSIHRALPPGGTLIVAEPMCGGDAPDRVGATYFAWYLLAMGSGRARPPALVRTMLAEAGFQEIRRLPTPLPLSASVIQAVKLV